MENLGWHTVNLYYLPNVVPRQLSCLNLQVKLSTIANAVQSLDQADPTAPIAAEQSEKVILVLGGSSWEAPCKRTGHSSMYLVIWEPGNHILMSAFALLYISQHKRRKMCSVTR